MSTDPKYKATEFPHCQGCGRELKTGEEAWASDWTVINETGPHLEVRYTCDDCHAWDEKVAMPATFVCLGCGRLTPDDDNGCIVCDLCAECTPAAGNCLDCADQRRVEQSERIRKAQRDVIW